MAPRATRTPPPYLQIAAHYRQEIQDGGLTEGTKLPSVIALADEWGVSTATAAKGLSQLVVEGLVRTSPRGSFVTGPTSTSPTPHDRVLRLGRTGSLHAAGEFTRVTSAEVVRAPEYVADLFGFEDDTPRVVRREWVTIRGSRPAMFSVSWHPAHYTGVVGELLSTSTSDNNALISRIQTALGTTLIRGRDDIEAREADARESNHLGVPLGASILCVVHRWNDDNGLVEYAEHCLPRKTPIGYEYEIPEH